MNTTDIPKLVKEKVKELDPKAEVILFGSRARGDFREDSDWDFLILLTAQENAKDLKMQLRDQLYELELKTGAVIGSLIHTKAEWEKRAVMPIYDIIESEGVWA